ncbi:class I SAM-dependent rRNA methyltransferase [Chloroflexus sp.]|uniref:class I SAM-dependent rRNA methyltransferase n=1 Tax=Chloroflexus sp. TaxID=1904827 RepID=UPI0026127F20|nr:class I SAM-dependent methyltransferase [uncultured Chloroflexus sp.]
MATIIVRPGRERPILQRHPWVFSGAIARVSGNPAPGEVVEVCAHDGSWLARGFWSSSSQLRVRLATWDANQPLDETWLRDTITRAVSGREQWLINPAIACRLVFSESDGLPGLIVDRYGCYLVIQLLTQAMATRVDQVVAALVDLLAPRGIYERSDADVREKEDLLPAVGLRWGEMPPRMPVTPITALGQPASGIRMFADLPAGQKTGIYLDQAINHARVGAYCTDADILDCFSYAGGFALAAARAGARRLTLLDASADALTLAGENLRLNNITTPAEFVEGDAFHILRRYRSEQRQFDAIILDPPKFAYQQAHLERATRGYKDINLQALHLIRPGGILATFSCSGLVSADLFQKVIFSAAVDARRDVQILERLTQAPDHPVLLSFPESEYLKGFICRVW